MHPSNNQNRTKHYNAASTFIGDIPKFLIWSFDDNCVSKLIGMAYLQLSHHLLAETGGSDRHMAEHGQQPFNAITNKCAQTLGLHEPGNTGII